MIIGDNATKNKVACVDPLTITIDPTDEWSISKVTVLASSGSGVAHFLDVTVGSSLVIDNQPLQNQSLAPDAITYESEEFSPVSDEVTITVANKSEKGDSVDNAIYLYSISLDLVYNPTAQTTPE